MIAEELAINAVIRKHPHSTTYLARGKSLESAVDINFNTLTTRTAGST